MGATIRSREQEGDGNEPILMQSETVLVSFRTVNKMNKVLSL